MLKIGKPIPATELASRLEVSTRTIFRDIQALSAAGVPVYCERGRGGGVALLFDCRKDIHSLSEAELKALLVSTAPEGARQLGLDRALTSARQKITAALPDAYRRAALELSERILIDTGGWLPSASTPHLSKLQEALLSDRKVRLRYQGRAHQSPVVRTADPYGLVNSAGVWYLGCVHSRKIRFYSVSRMIRVTILDAAFQRLPGLDLRTMWECARREFRAAFNPIDVQVRVRASRLGQLWGSAVPVPGCVWPEFALAGATAARRARAGPERYRYADARRQRGAVGHAASSVR